MSQMIYSNIAQKYFASSTMVQENLKLVAVDLEKQELQAQGGVSSPELYCKLLAIYIYLNDMCNSKYLWKRIPNILKESCPELRALWSVAKACWERNFELVFATLRYPWSENVEFIMKAVADNVRARGLVLVGKAYGSIQLQHLASLLGTSVNDAAGMAVEEGWILDGDIVRPRRPIVNEAEPTTTQGQLRRLTSFVSFLEN